VRRKAPPNPVIRSEFPTVSWYEPKQHYRIDARAKGGTQQYRAHRDEALALANQIAADYESRGKAAFSDPSLHEELLKALGTNPQEIIAQWLRTHSETNGSKPTGEAFDEFADFKQRSMRTEISRHSVIKHARRFTNFVGRETPLSAVTLKLVEQYLSHLKSAGNFNTWLQHVKTFLNFCVKKHGWITKNPAAAIEKRPSVTVVTTYTPAQIEAFLLATYNLNAKDGPMMRIWLALGAFAGIRPYEARRVEWEMILLDKNKIVIPKTKSKTSLPRTIPLEPNLKAWLMTCDPKPAGRVYPMQKHGDRFKRFREAACIHRWKPDALRHTYGSAMFVLNDNLTQVANNLGNTVKITADHYLCTTMTEETAQALFSIMPPGTQ
jgi:integrase